MKLQTTGVKMSVFIGLPGGVQVGPIDAAQKASLLRELKELKKLEAKTRTALKRVRQALNDRATDPTVNVDETLFKGAKAAPVDGVYNPPPNPAYAERRPWAELTSVRESVCGTLLSERPSLAAVIDAIDSNRARLVDPATPTSDRVAVLLCAARMRDPEAQEVALNRLLQFIDPGLVAFLDEIVVPALPDGARSMLSRRRAV